MRFLLTSAGIKNTSIHNALVDLLGKPIAESNALCIPTATYATPGGPDRAWQFISGQEPRTPMCELGWKSLGVLELTALPSIDEELWVPMVQETDVLLVNGGDPLYLCYWMRQSGLADLLPSLRAVYVGLSAGSMVMAPNIGEDFVSWKPPTGGDETLGMVGFSMFPHLDHEDLPENTMADAEKWAAGMPVPAYAIDDQTAIKVVDGSRRSRLRGALEAVYPLGPRALRQETGLVGCSSIPAANGPLSGGDLAGRFRGLLRRDGPALEAGRSPRTERAGSHRPAVRARGRPREHPAPDAGRSALWAAGSVSRPCTSLHAS